jgi:hypothetical protein
MRCAKIALGILRFLDLSLYSPGTCQYHEEITRYRNCSARTILQELRQKRQEFPRKRRQEDLVAKLTFQRI